MKRLSPREANARVTDGGEVAFIDVREAGPFSEGHPLFAVPVPYSALEPRVARLVPRAGVPIIVIDGGDAIAERAAAALGAMGYTDVAIVDGGTPAWEAAGLTLFQGVNVPSKTLGELAEALWHPDVIEAGTLAEWRRDGTAFDFFDVRPAPEHAKMRVPGARCLPLGELAHRFEAAVSDDGRPIVLTCAGRTRGLVGALSLSRLGLGRPVYALTNGTQGWALAGEALERGNAVDPLPTVTAHARRAARERADALMAQEGIALVTAQECRTLLRDRDRTTFVFDVRAPEVADADKVVVATPAPCGQLVQATDQWAAVRGARVVLLDDEGLRGAIAAFWLRALGYEPAVLRLDEAVRALPPRAGIAPPRLTAPRIGARETLASQRALIDVRPSAEHEAAAVEGAVWSIRPALVASPPAGPVALIGRAGTIAAELAAADLRAMGCDARVVEGGHGALLDAGATERPGRIPPGKALDVTTFAAGRHDGDLDASRLYLAWEEGLVGQLSAEERAVFRL